MKKFPATLAAVVLGAAGFTAAAVASGAHVMGVLDTTTAITTTATTTTSEGGKQPKVAMCHHTGSQKHPLQTITVAEPAVKAHLKHHDTLGACTAGTAATTTTATTSGDDTSKGHGNGKGHGKP